MPQAKIRVLDTGLLSAAENIAWDEALMETRLEDRSPDTIRFLQFTPSALVGYHQSITDELRIDYCMREGIEMNRRITGGGAIYFDEGQLGWEMIAHKSSFPKSFSMGQISAALCRSVADALNELGIEAAFRPRNDIEVDGRKISGTGGIFEDEVVFFQGTLLVDFNMAHMLKALKIPVEKLSAKELNSASQRVVSLKELCTEVPTLDLLKSTLAKHLAALLDRKIEYQKPLAIEKERFENKCPEKKDIEWIEPDYDNPKAQCETIESVSKSKGGLLKLSARFDIRQKRLKQLIMTGDVLITPRRFLFDLEAALKESPLSDVLSRATEFMHSNKFEGIEFGRENILHALRALLKKVDCLDMGLSVEEISAIETRGRENLSDIVSQADVMLVPYCAKPNFCKYRYKNYCSECGKCTVGEAYRMGREQGMKVITVNNYENFVGILSSAKAAGSKAFVGTCCKAFFLKRHQAFQESGLSCAIVDIDNTTCYDLEEEQLAYQGKFERETQLKTALIEKVLNLKQKKMTKKFTNSTHLQTVIHL